MWAHLLTCSLSTGLSPREVKYAQEEFKKFDIENISEYACSKPTGGGRGVAFMYHINT